MKESIGIIFFVLATWAISFGQTAKEKPKSPRLIKKMAFNQVDHFYAGGHIGVNVMFYHFDRVVDNKIVSSGMQWDPNPVIQPSLPTFRIFGGYKYKRHSFELGLENFTYQNYGTQLTYVYSWFSSLSYNIDLLYKKPNFKIYVGGQLGIMAIPVPPPSQTFIIPAIGFNAKMDLPITKVFSLYFDVRLLMGLAPWVKDLNYSNAADGEYRRIFTINPVFGCKFNIFSKKDIATVNGN